MLRWFKSHEPVYTSSDQDKGIEGVGGSVDPKGGAPKANDIYQF